VDILIELGQFVRSKLKTSKIVHPIFRTIVNKKANIGLSKPILVNVNDENIAQLLPNYFNKKFSQKLCALAKKAYIYGKSWLLAEYDKNSKLSFRMVDGLQVIDTWTDTDHDNLNNLSEIIWFGTSEYVQDNGSLIVEKFAKVYRQGLVYLYKSTQGFESLSYISTTPIMTMIQSEKIDDQEVTTVVPTSWEFLPWIPFTAYTDELSLIKPLKHMIDAYDETSSDDHDLLQEIPNVVHVFKGYGESDPDLAAQRINETRTVFLTTDGSYETVKPDVDLTQSEIHLDRLNNDIYDSASAVDSSKISLGTVSGIAIKLRYQDAIFDAQELCTCFGTSLDMLVPFILADLKMKNVSVPDDIEFDYIFNLDLTVDETDIVTNLKNSETMLSKETILENHPYVKSAKVEIERLADQNDVQIAKDNGSTINDEVVTDKEDVIDNANSIE
jgi:SPP1 family phage portal protein